MTWPRYQVCSRARPESLVAFDGAQSLLSTVLSTIRWFDVLLTSQSHLPLPPHVPLLLAQEAEEPALPTPTLPCLRSLLRTTPLLLWIQLHQIQDYLLVHSKLIPLLSIDCLLLYECDGL